METQVWLPGTPLFNFYLWCPQIYAIKHRNVSVYKLFQENRTDLPLGLQIMACGHL